MVKIVIDAGHGLGTAGKRSPSPDNTREWTYNNKVALAAIAKLNQYQDVQILRTDDPTGKIDVPLSTRTKKSNSWGADAFISIHHNALAGSWHESGGIETFTFPTASKASVEIAKAIHTRVVDAMGLKDRGLKTANFQILRETSAKAVLVEGGFMDSTVDIKALRSNDKLKAQGEAIAEGLIAYFNLKPKPVTIAQTPKPTTPSKGVEARLFTPSQGVLKKAVEQEIAQAVKDKIIDKQWLIQLQQGTLTLDDAFALRVIIEQRRANK